MNLARVLRLRSPDVFANLAAEEALFRRGAPHQLLFYVNAPCVVLGRTQNPFVESDIGHAETNSLSIARRRSGGGCVVHDTGNLNFCFVRPRAEHSALENAELVAGVLREKFEVPAAVNERADIVVEGRKISGAAYRIAGERAYHHGTLLVDSDLDALRKAIRPPLKGRIEALGTKSVSSPVANVADFAPGVVIDDVVGAVAERYAGAGEKVVEVTPEGVERELGGVEEERAMLASHGWVYGQIPRFSYRDETRNGLEIVTELAKGTVVSSVQVSAADGRVAAEDVDAVNAICARLESGLFDGASLAEKLQSVSETNATEAQRKLLHDVASTLAREVPRHHWRG